MSWYLKIARTRAAAAAHWLLVIGVLLAAAPSARAQSGGPQYIVQSGDTLYGIAQRFGVSVADLQAANPNVSAAALRIGEAVVIPGLSGVSGTVGTHALEPGESLDSLALRFGLKRDTLIQLNHIVNPERLYINESVIVVDAPDNGAALSKAVLYPATGGAGWLSLAAAAGQNPWALAALNHADLPVGPLPPEGLAAPGGDSPPSALPYPLRTLQALHLPAQQGSTLVLQLAAAQPVTLTGTLGDWPLNFHANPAAPATYLALQGIYRMADPGLYTLVITATEAAGNAVHFEQPLGVRAGNFASERLTVDPATLDPAVTVPEEAQLEALTAPVTPQRLWNGKFVAPSVGGITDWFGTLRSLNSGPFNVFHTGVDFSGGTDRPVTAPAAGVVVFTGLTIVRGNMTIIDHGWGVYTCYFHQSVIKVEPGQTVTPGEVLGYQGSTGRVTGPHLHWEMWVGGIQVNPLQWLAEVFP